MPKILRGGGNMYILLILTGIIGISYLINGGVLPIFTADKNVKKVVTKVTPPSSKGESGLQLKSIGYDPGSVTVIPTATLLAVNPTISSSQQPDVSNTPSVTPSSGEEAVAPTNQPGPTGSTITPRVTSGLTPTRTSTPLPTVKITPTSDSTTVLTSMQKEVLALARSQKGEHYLMGGCEGWYNSSSRPSNPPRQSDACVKWDCSNFVAWVYYWVSNGNFRMKSQTCSDYGNCYNISGGFSAENPNLYTKYTYKDLGKIKFGDLVYFGNNRDKKYPTTTHVGLYIGAYGNCGGDDCIIDASASGGGVSERRLSKVPKSIIGFLRPKV